MINTDTDITTEFKEKTDLMAENAKKHFFKLTITLLYLHHKRVPIIDVAILLSQQTNLYLPVWTIK